MFTIKWIDADSIEHLHQGTDPRYCDKQTGADGKTVTPAIFSYVDENKVACSMDVGTVYVMNENGKTVARYLLTDLDRWLATSVVKSHRDLVANPSKAIPADKMMKHVRESWRSKFPDAERGK